MPGGDLLPLYCIECDKSGISAKMMKVMHSRGEGMQVKCVSCGRQYNYATFLKLNPRKEKLALAEKMPPSCIIQQVWVHPEVWSMLQKRFPQTLMTTLCSILTALADPDTVMVEGDYAREMRSLGVERGRDVLSLAKRVKELTREVEEMRIRESALAPLLKALGGAAWIQQSVPSQVSSSVIVDGQRNPELPQIHGHEELVEDPESGMMVPISEFGEMPSLQRPSAPMPSFAGSVNEPRPPFMRRLG